MFRCSSDSMTARCLRIGAGRGGGGGLLGFRVEGSGFRVGGGSGSDGCLVLGVSAGIIVYRVLHRVLSVADGSSQLLDCWLFQGIVV